MDRRHKSDVKKRNLRTFAPTLFAGARINAPEIKALLQHIWIPQGSEQWVSAALALANFVPGLFVGFLVGVLVEHKRGEKSLPSETPTKKKLTGGPRRGVRSSTATNRTSTSSNTSEGQNGELKMVFVVRQDLKMGAGKIASQCAHAAVGSYEECLSRGQRLLLRKWEDCGQPKIVVTCKSQHEMNELKAKAERAGLPCFIVADAGRTQVVAGSHTVLAIGPGGKTTIDNVTRHLKLL